MDQITPTVFRATNTLIDWLFNFEEKERESILLLTISLFQEKTMTDNPVPALEAPPTTHVAPKTRGSDLKKRATLRKKREKNWDKDEDYEPGKVDHVDAQTIARFTPKIRRMFLKYRFPLGRMEMTKTEMKAVAMAMKAWGEKHHYSPYQIARAITKGAPYVSPATARNVMMMKYPHSYLRTIHGIATVLKVSPEKLLRP